MWLEFRDLTKHIGEYFVVCFSFKYSFEKCNECETKRKSESTTEYRTHDLPVERSQYWATGGL